MHKKLVLIVLSLVLMPITVSANIAEIAPQPCDPGFYRQMTARAWMESEREIMQNQNLIFKADTVFDYVCFDKFLAKAAFAGGDVFTHSDYFGAPLIARGDPTGLEIILEDIVFSSLENYRNMNFEHSWLGGRGEHMGLPLFDPGWILPPINRGYADYTCDTMRRVWQTSKCMNFVHGPPFHETDGYYPYEPILCPPGAGSCDPITETYLELPGGGTDARLYPENLACGGEAGPYTWDTAAIDAENRGEPFYQFQSPLGIIFADVLDRTLPGNCGGRRGIETGVRVILADAPAHEDGVCTNPGCTYTVGGTCVGGGGGGPANPGP